MEGRIGWKQASDMLLKNKLDMLLVGVYDTERFEPVSLYGPGSVHIPAGSGDTGLVEEGRIKIKPTQARAMYSHIKYGRSLMVGIDIADLNFVCIRNGANCLAGMSNFNMEPREIKQADRLLFSLTSQHYTRQDSLDVFHALNIAAILQDDVLIVGISKASKESVVKALRDLIMIKDGKLVLNLIQDKQISAGSEKNKTVDAIAHAKSIQSEEEMKTEPAFVFEELDSDSSDEEGSTKLRNKPLAGIERVKMRESTKSVAEKKSEQLKRQTSFCEDWRTATIRSIEALQGIGPFGTGQVNNDTEPLLDDMAVFIDMGQETEKTKPEVTSRTPEMRRESRVTDV